MIIELAFEGCDPVCTKFLDFHENAIFDKAYLHEYLDLANIQGTYEY